MIARERKRAYLDREEAAITAAGKLREAFRVAKAPADKIAALEKHGYKAGKHGRDLWLNEVRKAAFPKENLGTWADSLAVASRLFSLFV